MAHKFDTGFSVREVPWHGLGKVLNDYPGNWAEARKLAGLEWEPVETPVYEMADLGDGNEVLLPIKDFKQIKRSDTGDRLTIASEGYQLITHDVFGEIFEAILNSSDGLIKYETAGSLDGGRKVWVLAKLGDGIHIPGDPSVSQPYLALMTSHDGTAALRVIGTLIRIVCMNTWHAADLDATKRGSSYSFRHTRNWRDRVEDAKRALAATRESVDHTVAEATEMLRQKVTAEQARWFIREFAIHRTIANTVGKKPHSRASLQERLEQPRVKASLDTTLAQLHRLMEGPTTEGIRGSVFGLVQAAGEFSDHFRATASQESYFGRTVLADREPLKLAAVRIAREAVHQ